MNPPQIYKLDGSCLAFEYRLARPSSPEERQLDGTLVVIVADASRPVEDIASWTLGVLLSISVPERIWVIGLADQETQISGAVAILNDTDSIREVTQYFSPPPVMSILVTADGQFIHRADIPSVRTKQAQSLISVGMAGIFNRNAGLLQSYGGFHYRRPGGSHSSGFLRAANALSGGAELALVALALHLRVGNRALSTIYTDSASINSVAALYSLWRRRLIGAPDPAIESFNSWTGLRNDFHFVEGPETLVILSASTSGAMMRELVSNYGIPHYQVKTLYYLADREPAGVLCDLTARGTKNASGYLEELKFWRENEPCDLCDDGQSVVELVGDQLLPVVPSIEPVVLTKPHAPAWVDPVMKSLVGTGTLSVHRSDVPDRGRPRGIHFNLTQFILNAPDSGGVQLYRAVDSIVRRGTPVDTKLIIHLDDQESELLGRRVRVMLQARGIIIDDDKFMSAAALRNRRDQTPLLAGSGIAVVVASVVASGRSLLSISRTLRSALPSGTISYLVVLARLPDISQWLQLTRDLTYGDFGGGTHDLHAGRLVYLPPDDGSTPWTLETRLWNLVLEENRNDRIGLSGTEVDAVKARRDLIRAASQGEGLTDTAFLDWYDPAGTPRRLALQPKFAFWDWEYDAASATQAEVYATMVFVMQAVRSSKQGQGVGDHNWLTWSTRNFTRFNEGIIQASILRASRGQELNYASRSGEAAEAAALISSAVHRWSTSEGQAAGEYMLALSVGTLRLEESAHVEVMRTIADERGLPPLLSALRAHLLASRRRELYRTLAREAPIVDLNQRIEDMI